MLILFAYNTCVPLQFKTIVFLLLLNNLNEENEAYISNLPTLSLGLGRTWKRLKAKLRQHGGLLSHVGLESACGQKWEKYSDLIFFLCMHHDT